MIELQRDGDVFVLTLDDGENRFSPGTLGGLHEALVEVAEADGPRALVTVGTGKFFTNGLDTDWMGAHPGQLGDYLDRVHALLAQVLSLPCATVAAINGHAFGAGAMLAIAHDHRVLRADRGYWCLPEVDLGMPFTPFMNALVAARLPSMTAHEAMLTGRRWPGPDALAAGIAQALAEEAEVLPTAVTSAAAQAAKAGPNLAGIRTHLHAGVLAHLNATPL